MQTLQTPKTALIPGSPPQLWPKEKFPDDKVLHFKFSLDWHSLTKVGFRDTNGTQNWPKRRQIADKMRQRNYQTPSRCGCNLLLNEDIDCRHPLRNVDSSVVNISQIMWTYRLANIYNIHWKIPCGPVTNLTIIKFPYKTSPLPEMAGHHSSSGPARVPFSLMNISAANMAQGLWIHRLANL